METRSGHINGKKNNFRGQGRSLSGAVIGTPLSVLDAANEARKKRKLEESIDRDYAPREDADASAEEEDTNATLGTRKRKRSGLRSSRDAQRSQEGAGNASTGPLTTATEINELNDDKLVVTHATNDGNELLQGQSNDGSAGNVQIPDRSITTPSPNEAMTPSNAENAQKRAPNGNITQATPLYSAKAKTRPKTKRGGFMTIADLK